MSTLFQIESLGTSVTTMEDVFLKVGQREEDLAATKKKGETAVNVFGKDSADTRATQNFVFPLEVGNKLLVSFNRVVSEIPTSIGIFSDYATNDCDH